MEEVDIEELQMALTVYAHAIHKLLKDNNKISVRVPVYTSGIRVLIKDLGDDFLITTVSLDDGVI